MKLFKTLIGILSVLFLCGTIMESVTGYESESGNNEDNPSTSGTGSSNTHTMAATEDNQEPYVT